MPIGRDVYKSVGDANVPVTFDWSLVVALAISGTPAWRIDTTQGSADGGLVLGTASVSGTIAQVLVSGGTRGRGSRLICSATFANGETLERGIWLRVVDTL